VYLADSTTHDVQQLLLDCALLITDYSSVFFDVAYLEKPELYYQFDETEFRQYHYKQGYFDYCRDGFGPVCTTEEALLQALETALQHGMQMPPEYKARTAAFFPLRDTQNCARTYEAICSL
jgi:CDP-glycerol glycerophosphotransferase